MKKFVYMDAAASWQKPQSVIEVEGGFLRNSYANAGRGICARAGAVDDLIDGARGAVAAFVGADKENIVFTSGTTDGMNRIVNILTSQPSYADLFTFAVSDLDHHSARLPWENLFHAGKVRKEFICDLDENFNIKLDSIPKTDFLIITAMSNVMGVAQDVAGIIRAARLKNPKVITIVDAAQYVAHEKIDVKKWDCDFCVFSGHKIGADTGVGVLYIRDTNLFPDKYGGGMIVKNNITDNEQSSWILSKAPEKFEAGTLPITQIIGLPSAIDYCKNWNGAKDIVHYMYDELSRIERIRLLTPRDSVLVSFVVDGMHVIDFGAMLGAHDICVRVGNMCASWIHKKLNIDGSIRLSPGPWNTMDDAEYVVKVIKDLVK